MIACKICGSDAPLVGYVPSLTSCNGATFGGEAIAYHRCMSCDFLFTPHFDKWTPDQWRTDIYNPEYYRVDPDIEGTRAANTALLVRQLLWSAAPRLLDYGSWDGELARRLLKYGYVMENYDPFWGGSRPQGQFDFITCIETIEHSPNPLAIAADLCKLARGRILVHTLTVERADAPRAVHWYVAPRNGHVSIYSKDALTRLFAKHNRAVVHLGECIHIVQPENMSP